MFLLHKVQFALHECMHAPASDSAHRRALLLIIKSQVMGAWAKDLAPDAGDKVLFLADGNGEQRAVHLLHW